MAPSPNKLSQFWQELKRRKVIKVIAMYAGGAYVLIELSNNVTVPLNLPDWTPKLVILIALIGFPIVVVLSWIFDITPTGIDKTIPFDEAEAQEKTPLPHRRRLKVSDGIIVILIMLVGVLVYPRIFGSGNLNTMTIPVTVVNEFGEKETRRVFKDDYITRLALFPFSNEIEDISENWMGWGIMEAVFEDQNQFTNMLVNWDDAPRLNEQIAFAQEGRYPFFLTGSYREEGSEIEIVTRLYQTSNGAVKNERIYQGTDFFGLVDSICYQVRKDLGISEIILETTPDLPISDLMTDHLDAYEHYIQGRFFWNLDRTPFINLNSAIRLDSTFAKAYWWLAYWCYNYQGSHISAAESINQAIRHRHRLSELNDIETRMLYHMIMGDRESFIYLSDLQYKLRPLDFNLLEGLHISYSKLRLYEKAEEAAVRLNALVPNLPSYQLLLAHTYLITGKQNKSIRILNEILSDNPENVEALLKLGEARLHSNKLEAAEEAFKKATLLMPEQEKYWSYFLTHIAYKRILEKKDGDLDIFTITYKNEFGEIAGTIFEIDDQLFLKFNNQAGMFFYPVSDTGGFTAFKNGDKFSFSKGSLILSSSGKAIKAFGEQWDGPSYNSSYSWVEDSLIVYAKDLLAKGQLEGALTFFRKAYEENPEHYYLDHYIQSLELKTGPKYKTLESSLKDHIGSYGAVNIKIQQDHFFYTDHRGLIFELLPISEDTFMLPSIYGLVIHMVKENGTVSGLKCLYKDGREEYYQKTEDIIPESG